MQGPLAQSRPRPAQAGESVSSRPWDKLWAGHLAAFLLHLSWAACPTQRPVVRMVWEHVSLQCQVLLDK